MSDLEEYETSLQVITSDLNNIVIYNSDISFEDCFNDVQSEVDVMDYLFAVSFGLIGAFITTNQKLEKFLAKVHDVASKNNKKDFISKLFGHSGDWIDSVDGQFKDRNGNPASVIIHRLLWGHDIFSFGKGDNPFKLLYDEYGAKGILQAIKHLLGDTFSKQGLPLPFSSYFDYEKENGKMSNWLYHIAEKLVGDSKANVQAEQVYHHIFTIRAQDLLGNGIVKTCTAIYCKVRGIKTGIRHSQIYFMAYATAFFGQAIIGMIRQGGIPYINIPLGIATTYSYARFIYFNYKDIKSLELKTQDIQIIDAKLIDDNAFIDSLITTKENGKEYLEALDASVEQENELIDLFGGE